MLGNFKNKFRFSSLDFKSVKNRWESFIELDINNGTNNLWNFSGFLGYSLFFFLEQLILL